MTIPDCVIRYTIDSAITRNAITCRRTSPGAHIRHLRIAIEIRIYLRALRKLYQIVITGLPPAPMNIVNMSANRNTPAANDHASSLKLGHK